MASFLERLEGYGGALLDSASEAAAERIKREIDPDAPRDPVGRPETQFDTQIVEPQDGPESMPKAGTLRNVWSTKKWWIVGALGVTAGYLMIRGR